MKQIFIILFFSLFVGSSFASTISGYILDKDSKEQLVGATMVIEPGPVKTASMLNGKYFINNVKSPYNMTEENKFQNLAEEHYKEGYVAAADDGATQLEQRGFVKFLKLHPNIKAYFHGNSNWNEFYTYHGPDNDINLNVFRVDSPIKGKFSARDETLLSFQLISIDPASQSLTVRECLWNTQPLKKDRKVVFGKSSTVSLKVNSQ